MASETKEEKEKRKAEKKAHAMALREKNKELGLHSRIEMRVNVFVRPAVVGVTARALGWSDGRFGTEDNKHMATIAAGAVSFLGGIGAAFMGAPTVADILADTTSAAVGGLQYAAGYQAGQEAKQKAAAAG